MPLEMTILSHVQYFKGAHSRMHFSINGTLLFKLIIKVISFVKKTLPHSYLTVFCPAKDFNCSDMYCTGAPIFKDLVSMDSSICRSAPGTLHLCPAQHPLLTLVAQTKLGNSSYIKLKMTFSMPYKVLGGPGKPSMGL